MSKTNSSDHFVQSKTEYKNNTLGLTATVEM